MICSIKSLCSATLWEFRKIKPFEHSLSFQLVENNVTYIIFYLKQVIETVVIYLIHKTYVGNIRCLSHKKCD